MPGVGYQTNVWYEAIQTRANGFCQLLALPDSACSAGGLTPRTTGSGAALLHARCQLSTWPAFSDPSFKEDHATADREHHPIERGQPPPRELAHGIILGVLQVAQQAPMTQPQPCAPPSRRCRTSRCWTSRVPLARRRPPAAVRWIMWTRLPSAGRERAAACGEDAAAAQATNEEGAPMSAPTRPWRCAGCAATPAPWTSCGRRSTWRTSGTTWPTRTRSWMTARSMPPCSRRWSCCRRNAFYRLHFDELNAILANAITNWRVATRLERAGGLPESARPTCCASYVDLVTQRAAAGRHGLGAHGGRGGAPPGRALRRPPDQPGRREGRARRLIWAACPPR